MQEHRLFSGVSRTLNLALDVVSFAEESEPVVQHLLVLVRQVRPIRSALFGFEGGLAKGTGSIFAGEDCRGSVIVEFRSCCCLIFHGRRWQGEARCWNLMLEFDTELYFT